MYNRFLFHVAEAVRASPHGKDVPMQNINKFIATHLALAKDRLSDRKNNRGEVSNAPSSELQPAEGEVHE